MDQLMADWISRVDPASSGAIIVLGYFLLKRLGRVEALVSHCREKLALFEGVCERFQRAGGRRFYDPDCSGEVEK